MACTVEQPDKEDLGFGGSIILDTEDKCLLKS